MNVQLLVLGLAAVLALGAAAGYIYCKSRASSLRPRLATTRSRNRGRPREARRRAGGQLSANEPRWR